MICQGLYLLVKAILYQQLKNRFDILVDVWVKFFAGRVVYEFNKLMSVFHASVL